MLTVMADDVVIFDFSLFLMYSCDVNLDNKAYVQLNIRTKCLTCLPL
jgi:hypothetical protein